jgi:hypothetical protein
MKTKLLVAILCSVFSLVSPPILGAENQEITLTCVLSGFGKLDWDDTPRPVKIEQIIGFQEGQVTSAVHRFISDYDYLEHSVMDDGKKFGWLGWMSIFSDHEIRWESFIRGSVPKTSTAKNMENHEYRADFWVSRKTGLATREMRYTFKTATQPWRSYEYRVSGECKQLENKF